MKTKLLAVSILLALPALGCTSNNNTGDFAYVEFDLGSGTDGGTTNITPPAIPFIGPQIDRVGRPGINLMLTDPFDLQSPGKTITQVQDAYNSAVSETAMQGVWSAQIPIIAKSLAVWDGVDMICGNQAQAGAAVNNARYNQLAGILAADYLVLDTTKKSCQTFMAVELLNGSPECGGRIPNPGGAGSIIDNIMNILQGPNPPTAPTKPLTTGVVAEGDAPPLPPSNTRFPFLNPAT